MLDVMVFTAHRRGEFLLDQLSKQNIRFQAFDFTPYLHQRDERDVLGPFGFFDAEKWQPRHRQWLENNYTFSKQKQGWTVFSDRGTLEATGLVSAHQKKLMTTWAFPVGMSLYSTVDYPVKTISEQELFCDFFSEYYLPWSLQNTTTKLMEVGSGFKYENLPGLKKISFQQHAYSSQYVMNFLNDAELMTLKENGMHQLLDGEALRPRQCWQRSEILLSSDVDLSLMPLQVLLASKLEEPWNNDRFIILQRQENPGYYSLWYRTWYERHKSKEHFTGLTKSFEAILKDRIPGAKIQWLTIPAEIENEIATSLFPIYDLNEWRMQSKWLNKGVYDGSTDKLENYLWSHNMSHQEILVKHFANELKGVKA